MTTKIEGNTQLPIKGNFQILTVLSIITAILLGGISIAALLFGSSIYTTTALLEAFLPSDVAILVIGVPMLIASIWLTRRGKLVGLLFWPGALFFVFYNYLIYILVMPLSIAFLLQLSLLMLSIYTLIGLLASINNAVVYQRLEGRVPEKLAGGVLASLGLLFFLRVSWMFIAAMINGIPMGEIELALNITDFLIAPSWVVCGIFLWRKHPFGYVTGLGLLFQASMLFIGLILALLLQPLISSAPIPWIDILVTFVLGLICFIPLGIYIKGVISKQVSPAVASGI